jgi:hypothetical protein
MESAIGVSAHWSASSFGNAPVLHSLDATVPTHRNADIDAASLHCSLTQPVIEVGGQIPNRSAITITQPLFQETSDFGSTSILIPTEASSPSTPCTAETLTLGTCISRPLVGDDRSFTVTFCSFGVILSFLTAKCTVSKEQSGALWVHVEWLAPVANNNVGQRQRERIISLENIRAGSELVFECGIENSRAKFYLKWKKEFFSIHFEVRS